MVYDCFCWSRLSSHEQKVTCVYQLTTGWYTAITNPLTAGTVLLPFPSTPCKVSVICRDVCAASLSGTKTGISALACRTTYVNFFAVFPLIFCLLCFPSPSVSISHSFYLFPSVCSFLCPPLFFFTPSVFLSSFPFVCLFHYECSLTCPCTITKPGCLFMLHQGITLFFCYYFFCEVASVWLAPDSAPPSHPHYIFTLRYPRTQWCTCTHIFFFFFPLTKQLLCVSLFWAGAGFFGMWTWKAVSLFRTFKWWYLCSRVSFCFTNDAVCLSPL